MFAILASRPCLDPGVHDPPAIVDVDMSSASTLAPAASQSRAAKYAKKRSYTWLAAFSSRGAGWLSWSNRAIAASTSVSSNSSQRLTMSPSTVNRLTPRHSASKPSREIPCAA